MDKELKRFTLKNDRVDLKALAQHLGVSQATVSRALSGHEAISAVTRLRVAAAAKELGYQPNHAAQRLATGRANAVGLIFPLERLLLSQTIFVDLLAGITEALSRRNFDLVMSPFVGDTEESVFRRLASTRSVDGVVVTVTRVQDNRVSLLNSLGLPFVLHGRTDTNVPHSFVDIDNEAVFAKPANLLLNLGHKRIATLNGPPEFMYSADRRRGLRRAYEAHGLEPDPALQHETPMREEYGHALTLQMFKEASRPTAIICGSIFLARGVYLALRELGLQPGRDVSVIAHDDQLRGISATQFEPTLTATEASVHKSGERLAEFLMDQIVRPREDGQPYQEVGPVELVVRDSVSPPLACRVP